MNPQMILQMILQNCPQVQNNPMFQNAMQMMNGGNINGIQGLVQNVCQAKGVSVQDMQAELMRRFGMR